MREEKIKGVNALDLKMANLQWSVDRWIRWTLRNQVGLIIENGKVTGWDVKEVRYHE